MSGAKEVEALEAEGGEGGEASTDAHHNEEARVLRDLVAGAMEGERPEVADDEAAEDIDEYGVPGEGGGEVEAEPGEGVSKQTAEGAAEGDVE